MFLAVIIILVLQIDITLTAATVTENKNPCGELYITQSPHSKKYLQINWNFDCNDPPDTILLTLSDIEKNPNATILHKTYPGSISKGYQETRYAFKNIPLPGNWTENYPNPDLQAQCFDYYISSFKNGQMIYTQCLSIQPAWMANFGDLRIGEMMIPGTHNSGAYRGVAPLIRNFALNQDKSFWKQLVYGIRYFDIRVGRYGSAPYDLYINHAFVKCTQLLPELQSAARFLNKSPNEVIILNFHAFPWPKNFTKNYHLEVLNLVKSVFGNMIYPYYRVANRNGPKLSEFWLSKQRVIVSYNNEQIVREFSWLWPTVTRFWGNKQKLENLEAFIKSILAAPIRGNPMYVLMAELTPTYFSVLKNFTQSLKDMAVVVNRELSDWVRKYNKYDTLNIIATDFFTGNDMINVAIEDNFKKLGKFG